MKTIGRDFGDVARKVYATASGTLPNGKPVAVNSDGTVSFISGDSIGSKAVYDTSNFDNQEHQSVAFDSNLNKVVIAYRDPGNSNYGTAIVGTVSGTTISFGSAAVFESASITFPSAAFDSNSNKVVIAYNDGGNSQYGTAVVGTVSGTNISFGTLVVYNSQQSLHVSATFDSNSNKVVISYLDGSNDYGYSTVGTVSGTNISFGTPVAFSTNTPSFIRSTFDSTNNKIVIIYENAGDSNYGHAIVGTVSNTAISFGTTVRYAAIDIQYHSIGFDSNAGKVVIALRGTSSYGNAIVGTVSGTGISFGSVVVFESSGITRNAVAFNSSVNKIVISFMPDNTTKLNFISGTVSGTSISFGPSTTESSTTDVKFNSQNLVFDSNANKFVLAFSNGADSHKGTAVVFSLGSGAALTSENYIGMTPSAYPSGAGAEIDTKGAINTEQSGLTAGQSYYVQNDGTITTTAGTPSVFAGTAVSATKLIVKG